MPETPKAKQVLGEEIIRRQRPGQTVNDIVNLVPGVSFQNNDPWGSSGGSFTIRGFDDSRISQTLDGLPLNDSGNYALYTNQQVDPEVLEEINVNLGITDVDSPTASAVGGTINIRTREPADDFGVTMTLTAGDIFAEGNNENYDRSRLYGRGFVMIDTGDITGMGTKAFVSASYTRYNNPFNNYGVVEKQQYNGRIWQDLGDNGDFVAVAGHYNQNRNNFFGSVPLRNDPTLSPGSGFFNRFPFTKEERFYEINYPAPCRARRRNCWKRQQLRRGIRSSLQSVEHRQHPRFVAFHAGGRPHPDGRSELPVRQGQWRRRRRAAGGHSQCRRCRHDRLHRGTLLFRSRPQRRRRHA